MDNMLSKTSLDLIIRLIASHPQAAVNPMSEGGDQAYAALQRLREEIRAALAELNAPKETPAE